MSTGTVAFCTALAGASTLRNSRNLCIASSVTAGTIRYCGRLPASADSAGAGCASEVSTPSVKTTTASRFCESKSAAPSRSESSRFVKTVRFEGAPANGRIDSADAAGSSRSPMVKYRYSTLPSGLAASSNCRSESASRELPSSPFAHMLDDTSKTTPSRTVFSFTYSRISSRRGLPSSASSASSSASRSAPSSSRCRSLSLRSVKQ